MIPAFVNPTAGTAEAAARALAADPRFAVETLGPAQLARAIRARVRAGARRIVVAGGDGTVALAARVLLDDPAELAVLPGGTCNHFARSLGLTTDLQRALAVAAGGVPHAVNAGMVNDRLFLNTSSVGAYVALVHHRTRLRPRLGYPLAGIVSALALLLRPGSLSLELEVDSLRHPYHTPLLFVGVGARALTWPGFGEHAGPAGPVLHTIVVRGDGWARLLGLAFGAATAGIGRASPPAGLDSFLVARCVVSLPTRETHVALDGEIVSLRPPLRYRILRHALSVVVPRPAWEGAPARRATGPEAA